jgi:hypothetical protein
VTDSFDDLDTITMSMIGDAIVYKVGGVTPLAPAINGWVNHSDIDIVTGFGRALASAIQVEINKLDLAAPTKADTIYLPRTRRTYKIAEIRETTSGRLWNLFLAESGI